MNLYLPVNSMPGCYPPHAVTSPRCYHVPTGLLTGHAELAVGQSIALLHSRVLHQAARQGVYSLIYGNR